MSSLCVSCGESAPKLERPNTDRDAVILVSIDTLPASRVGAYGCPSVRTPTLDRLARQGIQVQDAISPAPITLPSHATMLTGLEPPEHGVRENGFFRLDEAHRTVAELLSDRCRTGAFVGAFPLASRFGLTRGFSTYDDAFPRSDDRNRYPERRARDVFNAALTWLRETGGLSFLFVHVYDPHYPYAAPPPWDRLATGMDAVGSFENEVAYTDRELGRFVREIGAWDRERTATILVTADHGEALGSHGEPTHGIFVYDDTQRIPMILAGPGVSPRLEVETRGLVDVAPTLLESFEVDAPSTWRGTSLRKPPRASWTYVETLSTEILHGWSALYGVRTARWKFIRAPRSELYDLAADPQERNNLLSREPSIARDLESKLDAFLATAKEMAKPEADEETMDQLRSLGYVMTAGPGQPGSSREDPKDHIGAVAALFRGEQAYLAADLRTAETHLVRALQLDPKNKEAYSFLSGTYIGLGRYGAAVEHARRALELEPHSNEGPLHMTIGEALLAMGRPKEAIAPLEEAVRLTQRGDKAQKLLARARELAR